MTLCVDGGGTTGATGTTRSGVDGSALQGSTGAFGNDRGGGGGGGGGSFGGEGGQGSGGVGGPGFLSPLIIGGALQQGGGMPAPGTSIVNGNDGQVLIVDNDTRTVTLFVYTGWPQI